MKDATSPLLPVANQDLPKFIPTRIKLKCVVPAPISHTWKPNRRCSKDVCLPQKSGHMSVFWDCIPVKYENDSLFGFGNLPVSSQFFHGIPVSCFWNFKRNQWRPLLVLDRCAPTTGAADGLTQANLNRCKFNMERNMVLNLACSSKKTTGCNN